MTGPSCWGLTGPCRNSIDGVSDRDLCVELLAALSTIMMHLSRFSEEIILWCSWEFHFVELADALYHRLLHHASEERTRIWQSWCRGKTGRVYGDLMGTLDHAEGSAAGLQQGYAGG